VLQSSIFHSLILHILIEKGALEFLDLNIKRNLSSTNYFTVIGEFDKLAVKDNKGQKGQNNK